MKSIAILTVISAFTLLAGCGGQAKPTLWDLNKSLKEQNDALEMQVKSLEAENTRLKQSNAVLAGLPDAEKAAALNSLHKISLSGRCGFYDKDNNSTAETLVVYLKIMDKHGDAIKWPGKVKVSLWNLETGDKGGMVGTWDVTQQQLCDLWAGTVMTDYYRLSFDCSNIPASRTGDYTVKVVFTDIITGRVFDTQTVVKR